MAADSKNEVLKKPELPDVQTLERVVKKHHERREYLRILRSTVASLLVVAAAAVIISMLFLPVLRVTGTSMTPTLHDDELVVCRKRGSFQKGDIVAFYYNNKRRCKKTALKESRFPAFGKPRLFFMPDRKNNYFG